MRHAKIDPLTPSRADYRILKTLLSSYDVLHIPKEYDLIISVFNRAGGKWDQVFDGGVDAIRLLKKVIRVAHKNKYLTPAPSW